jgi:hypothetical protein
MQLAVYTVRFHREGSRKRRESSSEDIICWTVVLPVRYRTGTVLVVPTGSLSRDPSSTGTGSLLLETRAKERK